ncbi:MAG: spore coat protein U domain-containing protein [Inquilinus limosus]|uniref:Spore coat protein U domain-containing protein n=1 Tax=Inquilinus limosus TaxID=171674 RepID=A0A952FSU5_9PROT|nr:spore coat protein U domain-containing protein [Inquilinus limosus]
MRSSHLVTLAGIAIVLVVAANCAWLPVRAQEAPGPSVGSGPSVGLGSLPGDNAPGTAGPRIAGASALRITITIRTACSVDRDALLTFPDLAPAGGAVDGTGSVAIDCTNGLPYLLALDAGGAVIPDRLYSDPGRRGVWGDRPGIGTGAPVTVPLHLRATPPAAGGAGRDHAPARLTVAY